MNFKEKIYECKNSVDYYLEKFKTLGNTLTDISFDCLPFLYIQEPGYNMKVIKVFKSYFDKSNSEAVRIQYIKIYEDFIYNNITYPDLYWNAKRHSLF